MQGNKTHYQHQVLANWYILLTIHGMEVLNNSIIPYLLCRVCGWRHRVSACQTSPFSSVLVVTHVCSQLKRYLGEYHNIFRFHAPMKYSSSRARWVAIFPHTVVPLMRHAYLYCYGNVPVTYCQVITDLPRKCHSRSRL